MIKMLFCRNSMRFVDGLFGATRFLLDTGAMSMYLSRRFSINGKDLARELMRSHRFAGGIDMTAKGIAP